MEKNINVNTLNTVGTKLLDTAFLKGKRLGDTAVFLTKGTYDEGSIWKVTIEDVDFQDVDSVQTFLQERSDSGESESFESLEDAMETYEEPII